MAENEDKPKGDKLTTGIALTIALAGVGIIGWGALWVAWMVGERIWG